MSDVHKQMPVKMSATTFDDLAECQEHENLYMQGDRLNYNSPQLHEAGYYGELVECSHFEATNNFLTNIFL